MILAVALIAAAASLISEHRGLLLQRYLFKPLPVLLMLAVVYAATHVSPWIRLLFAGGLVASAIGDIILINRQRFVFGLLAFLIAHICYIFGIWWLLEQDPRVLLVLPFSVWGGVLFWVVRRDLNDLEFPVLIYISVIIVMIWLAAELYYQQAGFGALLLVSGAITFGLSDTMLAIDHFRRPFTASRPLILITYYLAQICIAYSLVYQSVAP